MADAFTDLMKVAGRAYPRLLDDEILVNVEAADLNVGDTYMRKGHYVSWPLVLPFIPGLERAVIVGTVGEKRIMSLSLLSSS